MNKGVAPRGVWEELANWRREVVKQERREPGYDNLFIFRANCGAGVAGTPGVSRKLGPPGMRWLVPGNDKNKIGNYEVRYDVWTDMQPPITS